MIEESIGIASWSLRTSTCRGGTSCPLYRLLAEHLLTPRSLLCRLGRAVPHGPCCATPAVQYETSCCAARPPNTRPATWPPNTRPSTLLCRSNAGCAASDAYRGITLCCSGLLCAHTERRRRVVGLEGVWRKLKVVMRLLYSDRSLVITQALPLAA